MSKFGAMITTAAVALTGYLAQAHALIVAKLPRKTRRELALAPPA